MNKTLSTEQQENNTKINKKIFKVFGYIFAFMVVGTILLMMAAPKSENTTKVEPAKEAIEVMADGSVFEVKYYLKENLNDPDSYDGIDWSDLQKNSNRTDYKYAIRHRYRAANGFGAKVIQDQMFYLDSLGNVVSVKDYK